MTKEKSEKRDAKEIKRRLKKMQKHVSALRPLAKTKNQADSLDRIETEIIAIEHEEMK